jgi:hypothetical protein
VLGYPNPKELPVKSAVEVSTACGRVRYIGSDVTIWDKEFVLASGAEVSAPLRTSSTAPRRRCRTSGWRSSGAAVS